MPFCGMAHSQRAGTPVHRHKPLQQSIFCNCNMKSMINLFF